MKLRLSPIFLALLLPLSGPFQAYAAGIVLQVPIPQVNIGGAGAAGASLHGSGGVLAPPGQALWTPTLGALTIGLQQPEVQAGSLGEAQVIESERTIRRAEPQERTTPQDDSSLINAQRQIRTAPAPTVGSQEFQKGLGEVGKGTAEIERGAAKPGAAETSYGLGTKVFDGGELREGTESNDTAGSPTSADTRGFDGRFRTGPEGYSYNGLLISYGVPQNQVRQLAAILGKNHPGKQDEIYHNRSHSDRVAATMAALVAGAPAGILSKEEKALLLVAAALHDVDPQRAPGTPARVGATLEYIDTDPEVGRLLAGLGIDTTVGKGQLKTLIKFTDFNMDKEALAQIQRDAEGMAAEFFGPLAGKWTQLGRLLAFADQSAMYLGTVDFAKRSVAGLALEIRTVSKSDNPTNEMLQKGSAGFLEPLSKNPFFAMLPENLQANFQDVLSYYQRLSGPKAPTAAVKPSPNVALRGLQGSMETAIAALLKGGETVRTTIAETSPAPQPAPMDLMAQLARWLAQPENTAKVRDNPNAFRNVITRYRAGLKQTDRPDTSAVMRAQSAYKSQVEPQAKQVLQRYRISESDVVSHGTSLKGFLGMIFEGGIRATDSFGDGAQYWAAKGIGGATYLGAPATRGEPGVLILMENKDNHLGFSVDYTKKAPLVESDFLAVVITDGSRSVVLDKEQLRTLRSSAAAWKNLAANYDRPGWKSSDFETWDKVRTYFEPNGR